LELVVLYNYPIGACVSILFGVSVKIILIFKKKGYKGNFIIILQVLSNIIYFGFWILILLIVDTEKELKNIQNDSELLIILVNQYNKLGFWATVFLFAYNLMNLFIVLFNWADAIISFFKV
jgi:hypothetical protein